MSLNGKVVAIMACPVLVAFASMGVLGSPMAPSAVVRAVTSESSKPASESELAKKINAALEEILEEQFGALQSEVHEKKQFFGTLVSVDYRLKDGRLEDGWTKMVVTALGKLDIDAEDQEAEVRAENQSIVGQDFMSLQVTSSRGLEEPDLLGVVIMLSP